MAKQHDRYWVHSAPEDLPGGTEGLRECGRGLWCAARQINPATERVITPAMSPRAFCMKDEGIIAQALRDLPAVYKRLGAAIGDPQSAEILLRMPFGPSLPIRGDVDELLRLIKETLAGWEERVRAAAGWTPLDTQETLARSWQATVEQACETLGNLIWTMFGLEYEPMWRPKPSQRDIDAGVAPEVVLAVEESALVLLDGAWAGREILRIEYGARAVMLETDPQPEDLVGVPCRRPGCDHYALRRAALPSHAGDTEFWSQCQVCGHLMTRADYDVWVGQLAAFHRARLAAMPVLGAVPAPLATTGEAA